MDVTKNEGGISEADAVNLFARLDQPDDEDKKPDPSEVKDGDDTDNKAEDTEETTDADEGDDKSTDDSEEGSEDESETKDEADALDDERVVKVPVNGEEREFTIGALKRLAGQEAALTHKSQEVATARKQLDDTARVHVAALDKMLERARAKYEPYSKIDFLVASKDPNISGEELAAVRAQATAAYEDVKFLEQELGEFSQQLATRDRQELAKQAQECIKVLSDPEKGISGWSEQLYMDMRKYAVDSGIDVQRFDRTVDPATIKLLHKAYLYDKGQKKVQTTKTDKKAPKKIVKSAASPDVAKRISKEAKSNAAATRLSKTHRMADAVDAFAERFSPTSSDD
jgi:hypothetical protein